MGIMDQKKVSDVNTVEKLGEINQIVTLIRENHALRESLDALDIFVMIVDRYRQIVFANKSFIGAAGWRGINEVIGMKPGNIMHCKRSTETSLGCGGSPACSECETMKKTLIMLQSKQGQEGEIAIASRYNDEEVTLNFKVKMEPLHIYNEDLYIISFISIEDTIKKRLLEKVFFHDILNIAGGLEGYLNLIKNTMEDEFNEEMQFIQEASTYLVEEIKTYKLFLEAESHELKVKKELVNTKEILMSIKAFYEKLEVAKDKMILIDTCTEMLIFETDISLMKRVLGNMIKNALEATRKKDIIKIGAKKTDEDCIQLWVNNQGELSDETKYKLFQRGFSTKGKGRGIGTYSMKFIGEEYLGGEVGFNTSSGDGTTFYIKIPIQNKEEEF